MLEFDFRNGSLRRKYDGLKYALKCVEDVTYELSLLEVEGGAVTDADGALLKRARLSPEAEAVSLICDEELDAIRARMDTYDKQREEVIKQSRDVQKLAKQAIFSVHRGNLQESAAKLDQAKKIASTILAITDPNPTLRTGAFSNSLEEWAEGALTLEWKANKRIMTKQEMGCINTHEYIGALSDFTGEIGRLAVASASMRDLDAVRDVMQADVAISAGIMQLVGAGGGKYSKKSDAISTNLKKVEDTVSFAVAVVVVVVVVL